MEAGTGKTNEFKIVATRLYEDGAAAFFYRIEMLLESEFDNDFDIGDLQRFALWRNNCDKTYKNAYFFLDSVDEAKLKSNSALEKALRKFVKIIGKDNIERAKIFVSSRFSEWRAKIDLEMFCERLGIPEPETTKDCKFIYKLEPLNDEQIQLFASHKGVEFPEDFLNAIRHSDADILAQRPQDLLDLIAYWQDYRRLGGHLEMIEHGVERKLEENNPKHRYHGLLSYDDALSGAMQLASAATLLQKNKIRLPDPDPDKGLRAVSLDPSRVLTVWGEKQKQALLTRPIFDEAIYGAVRFHHRSVREFLTAKWLREILSSGGSRRRVEGVLFSSKYGREVVIPSMQPIAAWLACWDEKVRNRLSKVAPEVLVEFGDPSTFSVDFRTRLLDELIKSYKNRQYTDLKSDPAIMRRIASPEMSEYINRNLLAYQGHRDLSELFLHMIWYGRITESIEAAMSFCLLGKVNEYTRVIAFRAVLASGTKDQKKQLIQKLLDQGKRGRIVVSYECLEIFPTLLSVDDLFLVIETSPQIKKYEYPDLHHALMNIADEEMLNDEMIMRFLEKVIRITSHPPFYAESEPSLQGEYGWLLVVCARFIEQLVNQKSRKRFENAIFEALRRYFIFNKTEYFETPGQGLNFLRNVQKSPDFTYAFFWYVVEQSRGGDLPPTEWVYFRWRLDEVFIPTFEVWDKLLEDLRIRMYENERLIALSALWYVHKESDNPEFRLSQLQQITKDNQNLAAALIRMSNPQSPSKEGIRNAELFRFRKQEKERVQKEALDLENARVDHIKSCSLEIENLAKDGISKEFNYLYGQITYQPRVNAGGDLDGNDWLLLVEKFGKKVAEQFRDCCIDYWRTFDPDNSEEGIELQLALLGLSFEAKSCEEWFKKLSEKEIEHAIYCSTFQRGSIPDWLLELQKEYPSEVVDIFAAKTQHELSSAFESQHSFVLQRVHSNESFDTVLLIPCLIDFLEKSPLDVNQDCVNHALAIVLSKPKAMGKLLERLCSLAEDKFCSVDDRHVQLKWLHLIFVIEAESGIKLFEKYLLQTVQCEEKQAIAIEFFSNLGENRLVHMQDPSYAHIDILEKLIPIAYQYLDPKNDIHRNGSGAYRSGPREKAQRTRQTLLLTVERAKGAKAYCLLKKWVDDPLFVKHRDWLLQKAKDRAELDSEFSPWIESDIPVFFGDAEKVPRNESDLFHIACDRLVELKAELECGDDSVAQTVRRAEKETELRNWFSHELRVRSHSRYEVPQEVEMPDGKKLDLSFQTPGVQPVPVELKIAERWSYNKLLERLENQLVKQYMQSSTVSALKSTYLFLPV